MRGVVAAVGGVGAHGGVPPLLGRSRRRRRLRPERRRVDPVPPQRRRQPLKVVRVAEADRGAELGGGALQEAQLVWKMGEKERGACKGGEVGRGLDGMWRRWRTVRSRLPLRQRQPRSI